MLVSMPVYGLLDRVRMDRVYFYINLGETAVYRGGGI